MKSRIVRGPSAALPALALSVFAFACGGGGGGGGGGGPGGVQVTLTDDPGSLPCGLPNALRFQLGAVDNVSATVELVVSGTIGNGAALGAAFHLVYDPAVLEFVSFAPDAGFQTSGGFAAAAPLQLSADTVAVGVVRPAGAAGASGAVEIGRATFKRLTGNATTLVRFTDETLADAAALHPTDLESCWIDARLAIQTQ